MQVLRTWQQHAVEKGLLEVRCNVGQRATRFVQSPMSSCSGITSTQQNTLTNSSPRPYGPETRPKSGPLLSRLWPTSPSSLEFKSHSLELNKLETDHHMNVFFLVMSTHERERERERERESCMAKAVFVFVTNVLE